MDIIRRIFWRLQTEIDVQCGSPTNNMIPNTDIDKPLSRLLVVDDDADNAQVLNIRLVNYGFLVDAFTNAKEALQKFKSNPQGYCLVLSDNCLLQPTLMVLFKSPIVIRKLTDKILSLIGETEGRSSFKG